MPVLSVPQSRRIGRVVAVVFALGAIVALALPQPVGTAEAACVENGEVRLLGCNLPWCSLEDPLPDPCTGEIPGPLRTPECIPSPMAGPPRILVNTETLHARIETTPGCVPLA